MSREEFRELLRKHDWFYHMSDDPRVYSAGRADAKRIEDHVGDSPGFAMDYEQAYAYMFSGEPWGTEEQPKPAWWDGGAS